MANTTGLSFAMRVATTAQYYTVKGAINTVCVFTTDYESVRIAEAVVLRNQPRAQKMLDGYLSGAFKNKDVEVSIEQLLLDDQKVKRHIMATIQQQRRVMCIEKGIIPIPQPLYSNMEWKNTLGGINMQWRIVNGKVILNFRNRYRWHPTAERVSQCIHLAADNLKTSGSAAEFDMVGKDYELPMDTMQANEMKSTIQLKLP